MVIGDWADRMRELVADAMKDGVLFHITENGEMVVQNDETEEWEYVW